MAAENPRLSVAARTGAAGQIPAKAFRSTADHEHYCQWVGGPIDAPDFIPSGGAAGCFIGKACVLVYTCTVREPHRAQ